jgi:hypothetical protein
MNAAGTVYVNQVEYHTGEKWKLLKRLNKRNKERLEDKVYKVLGGNYGID